MTKYHILPSITIPMLTISLLFNNFGCNHVSKNNSDVIIKYEGHAEANMNRGSILRPKIETTSNTDDYLDPEKDIIPKTPTFEEEKEDVVFIPNEKEVRRFEDDFHRESVNVGDVMTKQSIGRLANEKFDENSEKPNEDILFISGKNNENTEIENKKERSSARHSETRRSGVNMGDVKPKVVMNCKNLNCNNSINSVCGGKVEHKTWKYRLFLNECFFRKVNCEFTYAENRYQEVPVDRCKYIGAHLNYRPYAQGVMQARSDEVRSSNIQRTFPSRRSFNKALDGSTCSHICPVSCPDDYDPECAVSSSGQRKVFANHCKLDYNSCTHNIVWHRRPLSECVGKKKADFRQNRAFIAWLQKIGIVNEKGRLIH